MSRLTVCTVFAAFVTACRLAIWPTSRSPLSVKPTTEGVVRPPSLFGMICTVPPSSTATQQLVVPKSIPITFPITYFLNVARVSGGVRRNSACVVNLTGRHFDHGGAQEFIADAVSALNLLRDGVGLELLCLLGRDCLVDVRIERLADGLHRHDAQIFKHAVQLFGDQ